MNRRNFLSLFSAGVAGLALEQAIPLGRVWSFPKKIVIARPVEVGAFSDGEAFAVLNSANEIWFYDQTGKLWRWGNTLKPVCVGHPIDVSKINFTAAFPPDNSHTPS
jgi:hypothetical protein